jgi:diacylglycerol kinase
MIVNKFSMMSVLGKRFIKSFSNAARGMAYLFKSQLNARIELIITCFVILAGIIFRISNTEWITILLCIALVLGLEGINTAIELLADKVEPAKDKEIGKVKDVAAGAVLVAALVAAIIGFIIFAPRFLHLLQN